MLHYDILYANLYGPLDKVMFSRGTEDRARASIVVCRCHRSRRRYCIVAYYIILYSNRVSRDIIIPANNNNKTYLLRRYLYH
jgi:hypothetical protein